MRRGDVVIVAAAGDYGKPRPAVVVQSDAFPATHASVILCQMTSTPPTSERAEAPDFRVSLTPDAANGLREPSQIMADKPVTVRRTRIGATVGRLAPTDLRRLDVGLAFAIGLAD